MCTGKFLLIGNFHINEKNLYKYLLNYKVQLNNRTVLKQSNARWEEMVVQISNLTRLCCVT